MSGVEIQTIQLGKVTLGPEIGRGGFGVVCKASLSGIERPFALKLFDPSPFQSPGSRPAARFVQEAEFLFELRHPHIVQILGVGQHEDKPYILMEHFSGFDLQSVQEKWGLIDPIKVLPSFHKLASALAHAHSRDIVHRDLKPRNIMVAKSDARILDFGIATRLSPNKGERLTKTGTVAGDAFSAPEYIASPMTPDPRSDIFSLGACWFWVITGMTPRGHNWQNTLRTATKIPQPYEEVLLRCLDQVDRRYSSASELADDISALIQGTPTKASPDSLRDDDAYVLGLVAADCLSSADTTTQYRLGQEAKGVNRFSLGVSLRKLIRLGLVGQTVGQNFHGEDYPALSLTAVGADWAEAHRDHIDDLIEKRRPKQTPAALPVLEDDIPF
ncbi:MAG: serine/threonine protein kinase [Deltaproteobacteria bacterium]|nr:serine/threonine protein kinase [Deltaproteobacteria bacterium]